MESVANIHRGYLRALRPVAPDFVRILHFHALVLCVRSLKTILIA